MRRETDRGMENRKYCRPEVRLTENRVELQEKKFSLYQTAINDLGNQFFWVEEK